MKFEVFHVNFLIHTFGCTTTKTRSCFISCHRPTIHNRKPLLIIVRAAINLYALKAGLRYFLETLRNDTLNSSHRAAYFDQVAPTGALDIEETDWYMKCKWASLLAQHFPWLKTLTNPHVWRYQHKDSILDALKHVEMPLKRHDVGNDCLIPYHSTHIVQQFVYVPELWAFHQAV